MLVAVTKSLPTAILRPGEADRIVAGHPWIYARSVLRMTAPVEDGGVAQVKDHRQRFLGIGFFNSQSRIRLRMLARERVVIDGAFFESRIRAALAVRRRHLPVATSFRAVNSESDLLSGLIVDCYEDVLVVQMSSMGMERHREGILNVLEKLLRPRAILARNDMASRKFEGLPEMSGCLRGEWEGEKEVKLNGMSFMVTLPGGHKTGLYLDQQTNYAAVAELVGVKGAGSVLDCFSFHGGFALHAARAGVKEVLGLDQSEEAVAVARRNAELNGVSGRCSFEQANVFDWLKASTAVASGEKVVPRFDAIILDPPSFTRTRSTVPDALRGYKEIHLRALKLLRPGGTLVTFCCSHHVDAVTFQEVILAAAYDARKQLRRVASFGQSADHPVLPAVPETEYLKGYAFETLE